MKVTVAIGGHMTSYPLIINQLQKKGKLSEKWGEEEDELNE